LSRSDPAGAQLSTYAFPNELRVDELLVRHTSEDDIDVIAPAFRDPAIGQAEVGQAPKRDVLPSRVGRPHGEASHDRVSFSYQVLDDEPALWNCAYQAGEHPLEGREVGAHRTVLVVRSKQFVEQSDIATGQYLRHEPADDGFVLI